MVYYLHQVAETLKGDSVPSFIKKVQDDVAWGVLENSKVGSEEVQEIFWGWECLLVRLQQQVGAAVKDAPEVIQAVVVGKLDVVQTTTLNHQLWRGHACHKALAHDGV